MKNKRYNIKVFSVKGEYKKTIKIADLMSDISFSSTINWGQSNFWISLNKEFTSDEFWISDFIELYVFSENYPDWKLIYKWFINELKREYNSTGEYIELTCIWLASLLSFIYYVRDWGVKFDRNTFLYTFINTWVDISNTYFNFFSTDIELDRKLRYNIEFDKSTILQSLLKLSEISGFKFYIWPTWSIKILNKNTKHHYLKVGETVSSISTTDDTSKIKNYYNVSFWDKWDYFEKLDQKSIDIYWYRPFYESDSSIKDVDTARSKAFAFLKDKLESVKKTVVEVNDNYNIEDIEPGDYITVLNFKSEIVNKKVVKVDYSGSLVKLHLDDYMSLWKEIFDK